MKRFVAFVLAAGVTALSSVPAGAAPASEYDVLAGIPANVLDRLTQNDYPDVNGAAAFNVPVWRNVAYQRAAVQLIWVGAAENDPSKVDAGFRAIALARRHMLSDGSFDTDGAPMLPTHMSFWLGAVTHALSVLQQSPLGPRYNRRIAGVLPMLRANVDWLRAGDRLAVLDGEDRLGTNRVFVDATGFAFASRLLQDPSLLEIGRRFAREAAGRIETDGTLPENGGFDSSYQGVSLLQASYYALNFARPPLGGAIAQALGRELSAIGPNGWIDVSYNTRTGRGQEHVLGRPKGVDRTSVILGLYYAGALLDDRRAVRAARAVFDSLGQ
jgi:hypothetical protein